jgi:hypothetical protein
MQLPSEFAIAFALDEDALVETEADEVKGPLYRRPHGGSTAREHGRQDEEV